MAQDTLPVFGASGARRNILYAAGCSGHGVGTQSLVGRLLSDQIRGIENPHHSALRHTTPSTLPEPVRWLALNCGLGVANFMDEAVNRKARAAMR